MTLVDRIAVTGLGVVSPFGEGAEALWDGLVHGRSGIEPIERFDTSRFRSRLAGLVRDFEPRRTIPPSVLRRLDLVSRYAVPAASQALGAAGPASKERVGVVLGTNSAGSIPVAEMLTAMATSGPAAAPPILFPYTVANAPASQCALILGLRGPNLTIAQKESSAVGAIATACAILRSSGAEGMVAGGSDEVSIHVFEAFDRLGVLSRDQRAQGGGPEGSRPFDRTRNGFVCGEGAAFLFLERESSARARGAEILAIVEGAAQGRAPVEPHRFPVDPAPIARLTERCVCAAGVEPGAIGAVFASANSTMGLDTVEAEALGAAFSPVVPPACSLRGSLGESAFAGAASAVAACLALREGRLPGTASLEAPDMALGLDVASHARDTRMDRALVTGFGSGGGISALVISAP